MRGQARQSNMVGIPGTSKGCTTCKRRKIRVSNPTPCLFASPRATALKREYPSAISKPPTAPAVPKPEGSARGMSKTGDQGLPTRPSNRLPIHVLPSSPVPPVPLIIRSYLSSGRGTFPPPTGARPMAHPAAGFSKSYLPPVCRTRTPCSCHSRL